MDKRQILKEHVARFVNLTDEEIDYFVSHFKEHSYKKGQALLSEGELVDREYFVNVDCITDAEVLSLSNTDREKMCNEIHSIEHFFREALIYNEFALSVLLIAKAA